MRRIVLSLVVWSIVVVAMAQNKLSADARLYLKRLKAEIENNSVKSGMKTISANDYDNQTVRLIIKVEEGKEKEVEEALKSKGVEVFGTEHGLLTIRTTVGKIDAIQNINQIKQISKGSKIHKRTNITRQVTNTDKVLNAVSGDETGLPKAYTGKDVVFCIIDGGVDFQHPAFKDAEGRSRIKAVYNPYGSTGSFTYGGKTFPGKLYDTPDAIASLTTDYNGDSHGSHTMGIGAGTHHNGWGGMAPDADIVFGYMYPDESDPVQSDETESWGMINEINFMQTYLKENNKPGVISLSIGTQIGPHNGKGITTEFLDNVAKSGIPVVIAAGNEGDLPLHIYKQLSSSTDNVKTFVSNGYTDKYDPVVAFARNQKKLTLNVQIVNKTTGQVVYTSPVVASTSDGGYGADFELTSSTSTWKTYFSGSLYGCAYIDEDYGVSVAFIMPDGRIKNSSYDLAVVVGGETGVEFDMWEDSYNGFISHGLEGYSDGLNDMSMDDWTSAPNVISVGAYNHTNMFRTTFYEPYIVSTKVGDYAYFTSFGTTYNNVTVPTITAPGFRVVSSVNHYESYYSNLTSAQSDMVWGNYAYDLMSGTSMSTPCTAGIVALWLEADPTLTSAEIKEIMSSTAINDEFTTASPDKFGYGKIDALAGIKKILGISLGIKDVERDEISNKGVWYTLQGVRIAGQPVAPGIYIRNGKAVIRR
ncbi:MAG: S8 family serine peptidase [Prevotella sp.]